MNQEAPIFSADLPRPTITSPPGNAPVVAVRDIVLVTGDSAVDTSGLGQYPPILQPEFPEGPAGSRRDPEPIDLGRDLVLLKVDQDQAERIMNACSPRGHYFYPIRQYGQRYTLVKAVGRLDWERHLYSWDTDGVLTDGLAMSRLVLDNGFSTEFAARVIEHENGEQAIVWLPGRTPIYRLQHTRDWLTPEEADELRALLAAFWSVKDSLPARVRRALWNVEYGCSVRWLDIRLPLLVIGFEGLISTSSSLVRKQFKERVPAVTDAAGTPGITPGLCAELYDARSRWAHGSHIALRPSSTTEPGRDGDEEEAPAESEMVAKIALFEAALRAVVRHCIEDSEFAAFFENEESVRERWPVSV